MIDPSTITGRPSLPLSRLSLFCRTKDPIYNRWPLLLILYTGQADNAQGGALSGLAIEEDVPPTVC
jgi:hypothetical protein